VEAVLKPSPFLVFAASCKAALTPALSHRNGRG
jgi:hypothetical protein